MNSIFSLCVILMLIGTTYGSMSAELKSASSRELARAMRLRREAAAGKWNPEHYRPDSSDVLIADAIETDDSEADNLVEVNRPNPTSASALQCKTLSTRGPTCWGWAIVYCPAGYVMTGGGMQSNYGAFERSHPYYNGWLCDNRHGCGSGTCYARCCKVPGFGRV